MHIDSNGSRHDNDHWWDKNCRVGSFEQNHWKRLGALAGRAAPSAAAVVATAVLYLRASDAFNHPQMWAEDATVFWFDQYRLGWSAIIGPYAGYLHLAPRLVAALASEFDVAIAPIIYVWAALLFIAWSAATATAAVPSRALGFLLGATLTLAPNPTGEVFGNISNVQWLMAPTLALILSANAPLSRSWRLNQYAFAIIAGLTGPFSAFLLPLAFWSFMRNAGGRSVIVIVTGGIQAMVIIISFSQIAPAAGTDLFHLVSTMLMRCVSMSTWGVAAAAAIIIASVAIPAGRGLRISILLISAVILLTTSAKFLHFPHAFDVPANGPRYFYVPQLALMWCALSLCFSGSRAFVVGATSIFVLAFIYPPEFFKRTSWPDQHWAEHVKNLGPQPVSIPINPGWTFIIPANQR